MVQALMILGTHSNAGKSLLATAFWRGKRSMTVWLMPLEPRWIGNNWKQ